MVDKRKKAGKKTASKQETEVMEMVRTLTHVPLSTIQEVLKGLGTAIALQYADHLNESSEHGYDGADAEMALPYIGTLKIHRDSLLIEWDKHSIALNEMINVKRAIDEGDDTLIEMWYNRLETDLKEKL
ncbi:MAG: hypothetical protein LC687_00140 [Actinobacteria bacterium]|nr:hypothetical protein [Actinomycetota bacterium]MCA1806279.1 hypothetical protein [Actinomycetota bacterium]